MENYKRLSLGDRFTIETLLNENKSIRHISKSLEKSPSTISREIQRHIITVKAKSNDCLLLKDCDRKNICKKGCTSECRKCRYCIKYCPYYQPLPCQTQTSFTYLLCNGCTKKGFCSREKRFYKANHAQKQYKATLSGIRAGFDLTGEQLELINNLVSPRIKQGQSPYHIKQTLGEELPVSETTLRRLIDKSELDVRNIDLRDKVRRKPRKCRRKMHNEDTSMNINKVGHFYSDYLKYMSENDAFCVQMDCVEGLKTDKSVLLTLHFPAFHFQLAYIMPRHTSRCVVKVLDYIEISLGPELFNQLFGIILTDNGHEFSDIPAMEKSITGKKRTHIFFCEPNRSDEKGACENNHKLIRYVIPKGTSLDAFTQEQITTMMNHINSYSRKTLLGKCPFDMIENIFPIEFFDRLGLERIPAKDINLTPRLFKN